MKKTKVENISNINLDFFLKQNKEDIRVNLAPGETSWCDLDSTTRSMILYERKNLIKTSEWLPGLGGLFANFIDSEPLNGPTGIIFYPEPIEVKSHTEDIATVLSSELSKETEIPTIATKNYKGKKRGRKKKRGPKKGSRKSKPTTENPTDENK